MMSAGRDPVGQLVSKREREKELVKELTDPGNAGHPL